MYQHLLIIIIDTFDHRRKENYLKYPSDHRPTVDKPWRELSALERDKIHYSSMNVVICIEELLIKYVMVITQI